MANCAVIDSNNVVVNLIVAEPTDTPPEGCTLVEIPLLRHWLHLGWLNALTHLRLIMADRYWVGGAGTWNNVSTTNWSASSGGATGASPPVAGDDVFFNSASNGTGYTVTMAASTTYAYRNITINAPLTGTVSFISGSTATHNISGSVAVAASGVASLGSNLWGTTNLTATTSGQTISLNGTSFASVTFNGVGGAWTITTNGSTSSNTVS
jgi:hypothetical protein